jgi:hypothetical protein
MTVNLPSIYCYDFEKTRTKIDFFNSIGLENIVLDETKRLMMSMELLYARYCFFTEEKGLDVNPNTCSVLFQGSKQFEKTHKLSKQKLLEMYPYKK